MSDEIYEGQWYWGDGWKVADKAGRCYHDEDDKDCPFEKYMDFQLFDSEGEPVIPIRFDHYEMIYDGDPIKPEHRAMIAASPLMKKALEAARGKVTDPEVLNMIEIAMEVANDF